MIGIRVLAFELLGDTADLGCGGLDRNSVLQTAHAVEVVAASALEATVVGICRRPELGLADEREVQSGRQYTDDGDRRAIKHDILADDVAATAVTILPGRVAQDGNPRRSGLVGMFGEIAAKNGSYAQRSE